ncbi:MAG: hypothetical protein J6U54_04455 [Clostridiales bacterium]|nr:hypothetical protein [Clostridiales bacterium]
MNTIDPTVIKETRFVTAFVLILSMLMEAIFLIIGKWDLTVLYGNLLSAGIMILNFFLLGLSVSKAMKREEKDMAGYMKLSKTYRLLLVAVVIGLGLYFKCFNDIAVLVPVSFPFIAIVIRGAILKKTRPTTAVETTTEGGSDDAV